MSDEIKEIYLSDLEWTKTHDNIGGVMGNLIFKDNMPYEEYQRLFKNTYFVLCNKDYITNLQTIEREYSNLLSENAELQQENDRLNNIINELEEYIKPYLYMLNGIQNRDIYEQCQLDDFTDIMEKLQELKENNNAKD